MNCLDCNKVEVRNDRDPDDWFCDDDQAAFCTLTPRVPKENPKYPSDFVAMRPVTVSARPHHLRKECETPDWCPLQLSDRQKAAKVA